MCIDRNITKLVNFSVTLVLGGKGVKKKTKGIKFFIRHFDGAP